MNKTLPRIKRSMRILAMLFILPSFILLTFAYLAANAKSLADLKGDYQFIRNTRAEILSDENKHKASRHEISPLGFTANSLLTVYQTFVSSQDNKVCNFTPSCSHFARDAINRAGFIKGSLMATDRLLRCHPYSFGQYRIDIKTGKSFDPVDDYLDRHK